MTEQEPHVIYFEGQFVKRFDGYDQAYRYGLARWGSGSLDDHNGWVIKKVTG